MRPNGTNNLPWTWQRVFPWKRKGRGTACVAEILYGKRERSVVSSCSVKIGRSASRVLTSGNLPILASCLRKLSKCRELRLKVYIYIPWTNRMYVCVKFFDSNGRRNFDNWYYFSINSNWLLFRRKEFVEIRFFTFDMKWYISIREVYEERYNTVK